MNPDRSWVGRHRILIGWTLTSLGTSLVAQAVATLLSAVA